MGLFKKKDNGGFSFDDSSEIVTTTVPQADKKPKTTPSHVLTPDEILNESEQTAAPNHALEALKRRMGVGTENESQAPTAEKPQAPGKQKSKPDEGGGSHTLLEKMRRYTVDEQGHDLSVSDQPLYQLKSVADILENDKNRILESLSEKYDISFDDLGRSPTTEEQKKPEPQKSEPEAPKLAPPKTTKSDKTDAFIKMVSDSLSGNVPEPEKAPTAPLETLPDISDIDNIAVKRPIAEPPAEEDNATIMFTPVRGEKADTRRISISSITSKVDLGNALDEEISEDTAEPTELEQNEFESFVPTTEFTREGGGKAILKAFAVKRRNAFLRAVITGFITLLLCLFFIPALGDMLIKQPRSCMIICTAFFGVSALASGDMLTGLKNAFTKKCDSSLAATLATLAVLAVSVTAIINGKSVYETVLLGAVMLFARALGKFWSCAAHSGNLRQIATGKPKKAVALLSDPATTMAMAKGAVEGDVLIAATKPAGFIDGFIKYSTFGTMLSGRALLITIAALCAAIVSGIAVATESGAVAGLNFAAEILCITAMPILFFINSLPLFSAAKKLNRKGAMIAGIAGAEQLENANAAVISSADIFPFGSVTLANIKVLSSNSIDDTIMKAASLTQSVNSPLFPIFQKIAGTNDGYSVPASDTVKYEDRMGISGWVDDELLFIGNRTLLTAHGIKLPHIDVDKSILKKGYFPIYLATSEKACALLAVQYEANAEVARELRRLTGLGITLLVDNCDPNISEEMICDYIGIREGFVKVMSKSAVHLYKNATRPAENVMAPAAYRSGGLTFVSVLNCASAIKKSNLWLSVCYILAAVTGIMLLLYYSFASGDLVSANRVLLYELIVTAVFTVIYIFKKP